VELRGLEKPVPASSIVVLIEGKGHVRDPVCGLPLSRATAEETKEDVNGAGASFVQPGAWIPGSVDQRVPSRQLMPLPLDITS
jgi:hypothetical protein